VRGGGVGLDRKEEERLLKTYSKTTGKSIDELRALLEEAKKEAEEAGVGDNDRIIKARFHRKVRGRIRWERSGGKRREPVVFKGFILGASAVRDTLDRMRREARRAYEEDPQNAVLSGLTDEQGNPLDRRETIRDRRGREIDNPNYGKPLVGHQYVRDVIGVAVKEGDEKPKFFKATLWRGFATKFTYRPFVPVTFKALINMEKPYYDLTFSRARDAKIRPIKEEIDLEKWIREALKDRTYALNDLERAVEDTQYATDRYIAVEGIVDYIDPEVNPKTGSRNIVIIDPDSGFPGSVRVFIPKDFPLAFREFSRVIVVGTPRKWRREDDGSEEQYFINGISIFPIPGETEEAPVELGRSAEGEEVEEEGEEGWNLWEE